MIDVDKLLEWLSENHALKACPEQYRKQFAQAAKRVFRATDLEAMLRNKFFVPESSPFSKEKFLQSACELSVANHIAIKGLPEFSTEKRMNPVNSKNVDVFYKVGATSVALEIKCAEEISPTEDALILKTAGRIPNYRETFADLKGRIEGEHRDVTLELAKNKDNTMKDFLVSANGKFSPNSGFYEVNILLLGCGYYFNMCDWWLYLFGDGGLFTANSFSPHEQYSLVDVVVLTNLKYLHSDARNYHDWTMENAFVLPLLNPRRRASATNESILQALSPFNHHMGRFGAYQPVTDDPQVPAFILKQIQVNSYVAEHLDENERSRYFPVKLNK